MHEQNTLRTGMERLIRDCEVVSIWFDKGQKRGADPQSGVISESQPRKSSNEYFNGLARTERIISSVLRLPSLRVVVQLDMCNVEFALLILD